MSLMPNVALWNTVGRRTMGGMKTRALSRSRKIALTIGLLLFAAAVTVVVRGRPIAAEPARAFIKPAPSPVRGLQVCWAEMARNTASGQVATAGVTELGTWDITVSGLVVRHPRGDLVIDVGNSSRFEEEIADYPFVTRTWLRLLPGSNRVVRTAPAALRELGVDPERLFGVILSHAHVDHAGGMVDLPGAKVLLPQEEIDFFARGEREQNVDVVPAHARAVAGRAAAIAFTNGPYETFEESADLFGDGSVVVVKLPGHTPGSVGTFVNTPSGLRLFHVGDVVNVVEAVERRRTKSLVMSSTDHDGPEADRSVARVARLHEADPGVLLLPAHDRPAWVKALGAPGECRGD